MYTFRNVLHFILSPAVTVSARQVPAEVRSPHDAGRGVGGGRGKAMAVVNQRVGGRRVPCGARREARRTEEFFARTGGGPERKRQRPLAIAKGLLLLMVGMRGFEPPPPCSRSRCGSASLGRMLLLTSFPHILIYLFKR